MSNTPATKAATAVAATADMPRKVPEIDPVAVVQHDAGQVFRHMFARLPQGAVFADLGEPEIWKRVQGSNTRSLKKFDHLLIVDYDETWFAQAVVSSADANQVLLSRPHQTLIPKRF